ncbi:MAG: hypothetical protein M5U28_14155 [Sandaracinaceae bacterium]|nr:hypothetical protein [Sandaracinaceae bacterium]
MRRRGRAAPGYPIAITKEASAALLSIRDRSGGAFLGPDNRISQKGKLARGVELPPKLREAWLDAQRLLLHGDAAALAPLAALITAIRNGEVRTEDVAFEALADVPTSDGFRVDEPEWDFAARRAVDVAVAAAREKGLTVARGSHVRWYVAATSATDWWERARLADAAEPIDSDWYLRRLAKHLESLTGVVGSDLFARVLRGNAHPTKYLAPRRVGWLGGGKAYRLYARSQSDGSLSPDLPKRRTGARLATLLDVRREPVTKSHHLHLRVRAGDLWLVSHPALGPDPAARVIDAAIAQLRGLGAEDEDLVRVVFDARHGLVVRAAALAIPDLANLHDVHREVMHELIRDMRSSDATRDLPPGAWFDSSIYAADALVPIDWLAKIPSAPAGLGGRLRGLGERTRASAAWRRVAREPEPSARRPSAAAQRRRLEAAGVAMRAPCADAIERRLASGHPVVDRSLAKLVFEARAVGDDPARIADILADSPLTPGQRKRHLRVLGDGGNHLAPINVSVPCSGPGVTEFCEVAACYRSGQSPRPEAPTFERFQEESRSRVGAAMALPVEAGRPALIQAAVRGGKTTAAVSRAVAEVKGG